jgi:hypothetical protein
LLKEENFPAVVERMLGEPAPSIAPPTEFKPVIKRAADNPLNSADRLKQNCPPME